MWIVFNASIDIPKGMKRRWPAIQTASMRDAVEDFYRRMIPRRFSPGNRTRYRLAARRPFYLQVIKRKKGAGQGKYVELQLRGQSSRWIRTLGKITGNRTQMILRMPAPIWFTRPFIGTYRDAQGRTKRVTRQPDKPAELVTISDEDRERLNTVLRRSAAKRFKELTRK